MINTISIVIPALNEEKYIERLLTSLLQQKNIAKYEIIVVDGGSTDKTVSIIESIRKRFIQLKIIRAKKAGISLQRNLGVRKARHNHILFVDADMELPKNFIKNLINKASKKPNELHGFLILPDNFNIIDCFMLVVIYIYLFLRLCWDPLVFGNLLLTTKANHKLIRGFNTHLVFGEDYDYGQRSLKLGLKYNFHLFPYVFHSIRRIKQMGRLVFFWNTFCFYIRKFIYKDVKKIPPPYRPSGFF